MSRRFAQRVYLVLLIVLLGAIGGETDKLWNRLLRGDKE